MKENLTSEDGESRLLLLVCALILSVAFHAAMMFGLSDCTFPTVSADDLRTSRKWSKELPVMEVNQLKGDPFAAAVEALGRPAAAPVVEDEYHRVERLSEEIPANEAPPRPPDEAAKLSEEPAPAAPQPEAPALRPREEIAMVENPIVPDEKAALPRLVIPEVPRIKGAPDISPPADLFAKSVAAQTRAAKTAAKASAALPAFDAPAPPIAAPPVGGFGNMGNRAGESAGGEDGGEGAFELGEGAVARQAKEKARRKAEARAKEKREEAEKKAREEAAPKPPSAVAPPAPVVDEKLVQKAKEAVRELRDETIEEGAPFEENVHCELSWWADPAYSQFKYFRLRVSSNADRPLPVVSKDVVYLIDVSGSIGSDRLRSCRNFVDEHIRTLNPGDRFNIAAFRNKVQYLFNDWRTPDKESLGKASGWLGALSAHGATDVFATLKSVHALPRTPERPVVALFITDGDATSGMTRSAEIISRFAELNDGLVSVYMYGVKEKANAYLMDMLARGNRGDWARYEGSFRFRAASGLPDLTAKFADPVLTDISVVFTTSSHVQAYPRRVTNLYKAEPIEIWGLCPADQDSILFKMRGLNGSKVYESMFRLSFIPGKTLGPEAKDEWAKRRLYSQVEEYTINPNPNLLRDLKLFSENYKVPIPYENEIK
jgi:Mg-chelatase subunit ChlD